MSTLVSSLALLLRSWGTAAVGSTRNEEGRRPQGVWRRDSGAMREREHEREALVGVAYGRGAFQDLHALVFWCAFLISGGRALGHPRRQWAGERVLCLFCLSHPPTLGGSRLSESDVLCSVVRRVFPGRRVAMSCGPRDPLFFFQKCCMPCMCGSTY